MTSLWVYVITWLWGKGRRLISAFTFTSRFRHRLRRCGRFISSFMFTSCIRRRNYPINNTAGVVHWGGLRSTPPLAGDLCFLCPFQSSFCFSCSPAHFNMFRVSGGYARLSIKCVGQFFPCVVFQLNASIVRFFDSKICLYLVTHSRIISFSSCEK